VRGDCSVWGSLISGGVDFLVTSPGSFLVGLPVLIQGGIVVWSTWRSLVSFRGECVSGILFDSDILMSLLYDVQFRHFRSPLMSFCMIDILIGHFGELQLSQC
jgi:hypothetical protein